MRASAIPAAVPGPVDEPDEFPWRDPGRAGGGLTVQDFPTFLLERVASLARRKLTKRYLDRWGLSLPEWRVLTIVAHSTPTNFGAIVRLSTMDKAQISMTLRSLAARGWIAAVAAGDDQVGRARIVTITREGRAMIRKVLPEARRAQMRLLEALAPRERLQLYRLLRKAALVLDGLDDR